MLKLDVSSHQFCNMNFHTAHKETIVMLKDDFVGQSEIGDTQNSDENVRHIAPNTVE